MNELRQIAVVADEFQLVQVLRARIDEVNVSRRELSVESGLTESHVEKLVCLPPIKYFGAKSFWNVFEQLGYCIIIAEDPNATKRYAARMAKRDQGKAHRRTRALVLSGRVPWLITRETARELGIKGGKARLTKLSASKRRKIARAAITIRWDRVKAAVKP